MPPSTPTPQKKKMLAALPDEIRAGEHDDRLAEINKAIKDRYEQKKAEVLALAREVYGEDVEIVEAHKSLPEPSTPDPLPATALAQAPTVPNEELGGIQTVDPFDQAVEIVSAAPRETSPAFDGPVAHGQDPSNPNIESRSPIIMGGPPQ